MNSVSGEHSSVPRFFCDAMLGKLARRMRFAGIDTAYRNRIGDRELLEAATAEKRIVVTRDRRLAERRAARGRTLLLTGNDVESQWRQLLEVYPRICEARAFTRCAVCNVGLEAVSRVEGRWLVPAYVFETQPLIRRCPGCRRLYWAGTHVERMHKRWFGKPGSETHDGNGSND